MTQRYAINWLNYKFIQLDGYGLFGMNFIRALTRLGVEVHPNTVELMTWPGWLQVLSGYNPALLTIALMPSYEMKAGATRLWNYTMYEGTGLEDRWADSANRLAERMIVPHEFLVDVFKDNGVKIPIHVIPGGTDPQLFAERPVSPWRTGRPYTFLAFADRGTRKGWDIAFNAFYDAFGDNPDVQLIVKSRAATKHDFASAKWDHRIVFWKEDAITMLPVYEQVDCVVFPTRGEGWGNFGREPAMMGIPAIVTRWGGVEDGIDHYAIPIENYQMVNATLRGDGQWAQPDIEEVAHHMKWCYENREEAEAKGRKAARWLRENQTWDHAAQKLFDLMREYR